MEHLETFAYRSGNECNIEKLKKERASLKTPLMAVDQRERGTAVVSLDVLDVKRGSRWCQKEPSYCVHTWNTH